MSHWKKCPICNIEKKKSEFYKNKKTRDRLEGICKVCHAKKYERYEPKVRMKRDAIVEGFLMFKNSKISI